MTDTILGVLYGYYTSMCGVEGVAVVKRKVHSYAPLGAPVGS